MRLIKEVFRYILWIFGWPQYLSMIEWSKRYTILSVRFMDEAKKENPDLEYMKIIHERINSNYKAWRHRER